jgi:hypothetical protein
VFDAPEHDRYAAGALLGRGSMGRVVAALDRRLGRTVALKQAVDGVEEARFAREARLSGRLDHPGIVTVHDAGRGADGRPYYVMRLVRGVTLEGPLSAPTSADRVRLVRALLDVARAVAHAHEVGVLHRDLKPSNVLLGPLGEVQVGDWGLAKEVGAAEDAAEGGWSGPDAAFTLVGGAHLVGTPMWMAPEVARGEEACRRSDVFAIGAMLRCALGEGPPWGTGEVGALLARARIGELGWRGADLPPADLRAIADRATAPDRADRYPDAGALGQDLAAWLDGRPVSAYSYSPLDVARRFAWRWRWPLRVAGAAAVLLVAGAGVAASRVVAEERRAVAAEAVAVAARIEADARLASSLTVQALSAARLAQWPEAAVLAAHAQADPRARGVLAAAMAAGAVSLLRSDPTPCVGASPTEGAAAVLCGSNTGIAVWDTPPGAAPTQRWRQPLIPHRLAWNGERVWLTLGSTLVELDGLTGAAQRSTLAPWFAGHNPLGASAHAGLPAEGSAVVLDVGRSLRLCAAADRGLAWIDHGAQIACVCGLSAELAVGDVATGAITRWPLPPEVDANRVVGVHRDADGWLLLLFEGGLARLGLDGALRWQRDLPLGAVRHLASHPTRPLLAVSGEGGPALLDPRTGDLITRLPARDRGHLTWVGDLLHTWGDRHAVWRLSERLLPPVLRSDAGIAVAAWSTDGRRVAWGDGDGDVRVVDGGLNPPDEGRWQDGVIKALVLRDEDLLVGAMRSPGVSVFRGGAVVARWPSEYVLRRMGRLPDGSVWAVPVEVPPLRWWEDGRTEELGPSVVDDGDLAPDGASLVFANAELGVLRVRVDPTGAVGPQELVSPRRGLRSVAADLGGGWVEADVDVVRRCRSDGVCAELAVPAPLDLAVSRDGRLAIGTASGDVWVVRGLEREAVLQGHDDRVVWVGWSPTDDELLSASWDGTARRWALADVSVAEVEARWGLVLHNVLGEVLGDAL